MMEVRIRKHTHTQLTTTSDGKTDGTEQSSPNIWVQMWGRQLEPIPKCFLSLRQRWNKTIKKRIVTSGNISFDFQDIKQLKHTPRFLSQGRLKSWPKSSSSHVAWLMRRHRHRSNTKKKTHPTFSETEWTLPKLSSRTTKQKQNFNECVERISTMVSGRDISEKNWHLWYF